MKHLFEWIIPQVFFAPDGAEGGESKEPDEIEGEDQNQEPEEVELTDDLDLSELDSESIYEIMELDNIQEDKILDWVKTGMKEKLLYKDVKVAKEETKTDDAADQQVSDQDKDAVSDPEDKDKSDVVDDSKKDGDSTTKEPGKTDSKDDVNADKTAEAKTIKITDEYITKQIANLKEQLKGKDPDAIEKQVSNLESILGGVKGDEMTPRVLRNYVNAQNYIKTLKTPFDKDWKPDPAVVNTPEYIEKATKQKQLMIAEAIKQKYPDYPADADLEAIQDFEDGLSNREYDAYKELRDGEGKRISDNYDRHQHLAENWEDIARDTLQSEIQLFKKSLEDKKISLKDLGIQSLDLDDKLYNEYLYNNLLFDAKGNPNPNVFTFVDNVIPVVKPMSVFNALRDLHFDNIIALREAAARKEAYRKGIDDQPDPSLSDYQQQPGQRDEIEIDDKSFDDDLSLEENEKLLQRVKNTILKRGKR
jgi:hypothetical protein